MATSDHPSRRTFLRTAALAAGGLLGSGAIGPSERLLAAIGAGAGPDDPEVPNKIVAKILDDISRGRPINRGHLSLDMPAAAEDGRIVPVIIESDLPMTPDRYVKAIHLVVDFNPDAHLAVFELSPAVGTVSLSTRIKMKRSTWVRAIAETSGGELWAAYAHVNVTLNGCG
jgi:sulfur-oxidizing protein SoxY